MRLNFRLLLLIIKSPSLAKYEFYSREVLLSLLNFSYTLVRVINTSFADFEFPISQVNDQSTYLRHALYSVADRVFKIVAAAYRESPTAVRPECVAIDYNASQN